MNKENNEEYDIIDQDLYEEFTEEEMYELVQEAKKDVLIKEEQRKINRETKRRLPKWIFWLISFALLLNVAALIPQTFSIPAIDFLFTSAKLSAQSDIKTYKKAVVVIETDDSKGTGFSITSDGLILTNEHVVRGEDSVTVAFPDNGLFKADVKHIYPEIDMAVIQVVDVEEALPALKLAEHTQFSENEPINFIGNPLRFQGIANEGKIIGYTQLKSWDEKVVMIQAPVYRGNSGSPILNKAGEVIGVIFATLDHVEHGKVGLFVPIDYYYSYHVERE